MNWTLVSTAAATAILGLPAAAGASNDDCLACHDDASLTNSAGRSVAVSATVLQSSVHNGLECTSCHTQPASYQDVPHFPRYRPVDCSTCHEAATASFEESFHGEAVAQASAKAPRCATCHAARKDPHSIQHLGTRSAENACRRCHQTETERYDAGVHAAAAKQGKDSPGCTSCHPTHGKALPPSTGAINRTCQGCHPGSMHDVSAGGHPVQLEGKLSCASCHDVHATHKPHLDETTLQACNTCHPDHQDQFTGSVHEPLVEAGEMSCLACHRTHQVQDAQERESFGCGACHEEAEQEYRKSIHRLARLRGDQIAATCGDCHGGHRVLALSDPNNAMHRTQVPKTCGRCHGDKAVVTVDFVRLPISLPRYLESVHGRGWKDGKGTAVCTDCHGSHALEGAASPTSMIAKANLASTCAKCHDQQSAAYGGSVHGRAVAHGIHDSPSCSDCHEEHLILGPADPDSPVNASHLVQETCARCHQDAEMAAKYGLPPEVVQSYEDSYHGWAVRRGGEKVAVCIDCHNTHDIRSVLDPQSSIHAAHVVETCGRCHKSSNAQFAASYTHVLARGKRMPWDWVRLGYIWALAFILGGMLLHNVVIYAHDMRRDYCRRRAEPSVQRMNASDILQHVVLLVTFVGLAVSGFALRFPDAWWVKILSGIGFTEELRRGFHRTMAIGMVLGAVYHVVLLAATRRGRKFVRGVLPGFQDARGAVATMAYYLGLRRQKPQFGMFDYTQKAEYWALVWGTLVMGATGLVLWFPTLATTWFPPWVVRVCEVIHFYEAILAASAIVIWHMFFVVIRPSAYPMSWIWITGRMPLEEWEHHHGRAAAEEAREAERGSQPLSSPLDPKRGETP